MPSRPHVDQEDVLLEELERLPLAIKQAAAFMVENAMDIQTYLKVFEKESAKLLSEEFRDSRRYPGVSNATMVTWAIYFERIKHAHSAAADLLAIMSYYDRQGIPKSLLAHSQDSRFDYEIALGTLKAFSLVQPSNGGETYGMHRFVKMAMKCWLDEHGELQDYRERAIDLNVGSLSYKSQEAWTECAKLFPHAQVVLGTEAAFSRGSLERAILLENVSYYLVHRGLYTPAKAMSQECVDIRTADIRTADIRTAELGNEHRATIDAQVDLAFCLEQTGSTEEAEKILRQAKEACEKLL